MDLKIGYLVWFLTLKVGFIIAAMDIKKIFGANLRKYRKERSLSQEQLAERAGVSVKHIGALESGSSFVSAELLQDFCAVLGVPAHFFFMEESSIDLGGFPLGQIDQIVHGLLIRDANIISNEIKRKILAYSSLGR